MCRALPLQLLQQISFGPRLPTRLGLGRELQQLRRENVVIAHTESGHEGVAQDGDTLRTGRFFEGPQRPPQAERVGHKPVVVFGAVMLEISVYRQAEQVPFAGMPEPTDSEV